MVSSFIYFFFKTKSLNKMPNSYCLVTVYYPFVYVAFANGVFAA